MNTPLLFIYGLLLLLGRINDTFPSQNQNQVSCLYFDFPGLLFCYHCIKDGLVLVMTSSWNVWFPAAHCSHRHSSWMPVFFFTLSLFFPFPIVSFLSGFCARHNHRLSSSCPAVDATLSFEFGSLSSRNLRLTTYFVSLVYCWCPWYLPLLCLCSLFPFQVSIVTLAGGFTGPTFGSIKQYLRYGFWFRYCISL